MNSFSKKVGIINLGISNLGSITNLITHLKREVEIINDYSQLDKFSHVILPGIGSFKEASKIIKKKNLKKNIKNFIDTNGKFFGICLGMQLMFESSEEHGKSNGLGIIKGKCSQIRSKKLKIPHIGFNKIQHDNHYIWKKIPKKSSFYFVHSYKIDFKKNYNDVYFIYCKYEKPFIAFLRKGNIFGSQFHPEKSGKFGIKLIENFLKIK